MANDEIKISPDQNTLEYKGGLYEFIEGQFCRACDLKNKGICKFIPCSNFEYPKRIDNIECGSFNLKGI